MEDKSKEGKYTGLTNLEFNLDSLVEFMDYLKSGICQGFNNNSVVEISLYGLQKNNVVIQVVSKAGYDPINPERKPLNKFGHDLERTIKYFLSVNNTYLIDNFENKKTIDKAIQKIAVKKWRQKAFNIEYAIEAKQITKEAPNSYLLTISMNTYNNMYGAFAADLFSKAVQLKSITSKNKE